MKTRGCKQWVAAMMLPLAVAVFQERGEAATADSLGPITSSAEAIDRALDYTGIDRFIQGKAQNPDELARSVVLHDSTTPFLSGQITCRPTWEVTFQNVYLNWRGDETDTAVYQAKTLVLYLDSATGQFIKLDYVDQGIDRDTLAWCSAEEAADQIGRMGESYSGLPTMVPKLDLAEVMASFLPASPEAANRCEVLYVNHQMPDGVTRAAWVITLHWLKSSVHRRYVVDAETGAEGPITNYPFYRNR